MAASEKAETNVLERSQRSMEMRGTILIVEDDATISKLLRQRLSVRHYDCITASNGEDALRIARTAMPDMILLDLMLPRIDGFEVKRRLNEDDITAGIPVIFLTARDAVEDKVRGFGLDAVDYVCKPFEFAELMARIDTAIRRRRNFEQKISTDPLTGLNNLFFLKKQMQFYFEAASRYDRPLTLAVVDIDEFKAINDEYGHAAGDAVIRSLAVLMKRVFRKADIPIRYGGDEFVVVFPETALSDAESSLERLEQAAEEDVVVLPRSLKEVRYSISTGAAGFQKHFKSPEEIFEAADRKMYERKASRSAKKRHSA